MVEQSHSLIGSGGVPAKTATLALGIDSLLDNSVTDFNLYLEMGDALVLFAAAPYHWTREELNRLLADRHKNLYYSSADHHKVEAYKRVQQIPKIDLSGPPAARILNLTDAAAELTRVLYDHPLTASSLSKGSEIAKGMVAAILEDRSSVKALGKLAHHDYYTYYHSARVAAYALAIALQMSVHDEEHLQDIAIGCLFHDVGKSKVDLTVLNKHGPLTPEEWVQMRLHPVFGDESVKDSILSHVPREIILHHHEKLDGGGYPHDLSANELLSEVRIATFADIFDALTTNRPYQVSRTRFEALDLIKNKMLNHLDKDVYKVMIEILNLEEGKKS